MITYEYQVGKRTNPYASTARGPKPRLSANSSTSRELARYYTIINIIHNTILVR